MHFYQQTKITATAAFERGRVTEGRAAKGSRCAAVLCHPWTRLAFPGKGLSAQKGKRPNKPAISPRQSNGGVTKDSIAVPAQTVSATDSQSVPWRAQQQGQTLQSREL